MVLFCYPEGRTRAVTLSYDDGTIHDRRLVGILNRHGLKGSFHLNSARLGLAGFVAPEEVAALYRGHEVSCHGATHVIEALAPRGLAAGEVWRDRLALEKLCGDPVCGMSYPNNSYDSETMAGLRAAGIVCSRTTESTGGFALPRNFLAWHPSCHHKQALERLPAFLERPGWDMPLFFVWGHSYEFENDGDWELIEEFAQRVSGKEDVWYATNIEICRYVTAIHRLVVSADGRTFRNLSAIPVWFRDDDELRSVGPGETVRL